MDPVHHKRQNGWNFIFSVIFVAVLAAAVSYLSAVGQLPHQVPPFDVALMAFATLRVARLVVYDRIARWFRELFDRDGGLARRSATAEGFFETIRDLLECPWCVGVWAALIIAFCYEVFPWAWFVIFFLALAGMGSLLQVVANALGWYAENLKLEAKERQRDLL